MKNLLVLLVAFLFSANVNAGLYDGDLLEPAIGAGAGALYGATSGAGFLTIGIYAGVGFLAGHTINKYYDHKVGKKYTTVQSDLKDVIRRLQTVHAIQSEEGLDKGYGIRIRKVIPGKKLPDGSVRPPTFEEKLISPDAGLPVGD